MITRFFDEFEGLGEPNSPIDRTMLESPEFRAMLFRLRQRSDSDVARVDHWAQCTSCCKWRKVGSHAAAEAAKGIDWTCSFLNDNKSENENGDGDGSGDGDNADGGGGAAAAAAAAALRPSPLFTCDTPLSREETEGVHYAPRAAVEAGLASGSGPGTQVGDGPVQRQGGGGGGGTVSAAAADAPEAAVAVAPPLSPPPTALPCLPLSPLSPPTPAAAAAIATAEIVDAAKSEEDEDDDDDDDESSERNGGSGRKKRRKKGGGKETVVAPAAATAPCLVK